MMLPLKVVILARAIVKHPFLAAHVYRLLDISDVSGNSIDDGTARRFDGQVAMAARTDVAEIGGSTASQKKKSKPKPLLTWEEKFAVLKAFKTVYGHCRVPPGFMIGGFNLGGWVATQRKEFLKHRIGIPSFVINDKRVSRLDRAGFDWSAESEWSLPLTSIKRTQEFSFAAS